MSPVIESWARFVVGGIPKASELEGNNFSSCVFESLDNLLPPPRRAEVPMHKSYDFLVLRISISDSVTESLTVWEISILKHLSKDIRKLYSSIYKWTNKYGYLFLIAWIKFIIRLFILILEPFEQNEKHYFIKKKQSNIFYW